MEKTDSFGYWVRRQRKALDLTQQELAQRVGCAVITLRKIEADERRPSPEMATRLAQCLELPAPQQDSFVAIAAGQRRAFLPPLPLPAAGAMSGNLPAPAASLVGRSEELTAISRLLREREARLLTLTGPVGVGKTRLAIAAGRQLHPAYRHGVHLVELAGVRDPALVEAATAAALGVREAPRQRPAQAVTGFLRGRRLLLIFDNFEHLLPAGPFLSALLAGCPDLQLLVTSRARLHLYGEHEFAVSPLTLPDARDPTAADSPAVRLFCERARAARAGFRLTPAVTPAVVEICRRLDGLPLAIELAAARAHLFSPPDLLQRLENLLPLLERGPADQPPRLQGLQEAIAWSYGLLSAAESRLLACLAVFEGGFTLAAVEAVAPTGSRRRRPDVALGVAELLDQSLLARQAVEGGNQSCSDCPAGRLRQAIADEPRFTMLTVVRDFLRRHPASSAVLPEARRRHAAYFADLAAEAATHFDGPQQGLWMARLEREADNLRLALRRLLSEGRTERAARMVCDLGVLWQRHGRYSEGRAWLQQLRAQLDPAQLPLSLRARLMRTAATLAYRQGDYLAARLELAECMELYRSTVDRAGMAEVTFDLGWIAVDQGEWSEAIRLNEESLALVRDVRETTDEAGRKVAYQALTNLGWAYLCLSRWVDAGACFEEALTLARQLGHTRGVAVSLLNLGWIALHDGCFADASRLARVGLRLGHLLGERELVAEGLEILVATEAAGGEARRAAILSGAAEAVWEALHTPRPPARHDVAFHARTVAALHSRLPIAEFTAYWERGRLMGPDAAAALALRCREERMSVNRLPAGPSAAGQRQSPAATSRR